jgi:hypothetical protein
MNAAIAPHSHFCKGRFGVAGLLEKGAGMPWLAAVRLCAVLFCLGLGMVAAAPQARAGDDDFGLEEVDPDLPNKIRKWNGDCLSCHSEAGLKSPPRQGMDMKLLATLLVEQGRFEHSYHGAMACKDCHTEAYVPYPHLPNAKKQIKGCVECHQNPAKTIVPEFKASTHFKGHTDKFTCLSCHQSHYDRKASKMESAHAAAVQDNAMCLTCHGDDARYKQWKPDAKRPDMQAAHAWLPELALHLDQTRCVDCHSPVADGGALSHDVQAKAKAVRACEACHGDDSELGKRLYKKMLLDKPGPAAGFNHGALLSEIYVTGATRNVWLDWAGLAALAATALALIGRALWRRRNRRH